MQLCFQLLLSRAARHRILIFFKRMKRSGQMQFNANRTCSVKFTYQRSSKRQLLQEAPRSLCRVRNVHLQFVLYRNSIPVCTFHGWKVQPLLSSAPWYWLCLQWSLSVQLSTLVLLYSPSLLDSIFNLLVTRPKNIVSAPCKCMSGSAGSHQTINVLLPLKREGPKKSLLLNCTESL